MVPACGDHPGFSATGNEPVSGQPAPRHSRSGVGVSHPSWLVVYTRGEKTRRYRARVDRTHQRIELQSEMDAPETMPGAEVEPCGAYALAPCSDGSGGTLLIQEGEWPASGETYDTIPSSLAWDAPLPGGEDGTAWHCAVMVDDIHFTHRSYHFRTEGESVLVARLPSRTAGVVKGLYRLPPGPWLSDDHRARVWSGTVEGNCYFQWQRIPGIALIEYGLLAVYKFAGQWEELPEDVPGGGVGGSGSGSSNGSESEGGTDDDEAARVMMYWLETGLCTDGWAIIVDDVQVC